MAVLQTAVLDHFTIEPDKLCDYFKGLLLKKQIIYIFRSQRALKRE